ncbi:MAG TPA: ATP-dependent DNA ligase, partial [Polyangiaceae bacterium]|nr:ATP-dependent DNA ligase [Polyangiaceae bacterium]
RESEGGPHLEAGVAYLAGELPGGRIGLGHAAVYGHGEVPAASSATLQVGDVERALRTIQTVRGAGSVSERARLWGPLLASATAAAQEFLRHLVLGELRQGALQSLVAEAVARAANVQPASVRRALMLSGSLTEIARAALSGGEEALARYRIQLFRPLEPMLAQSAETPEAALTDWGRAGFEYKLDGVRIQAHKSGSDVRIFTRQLSDVTAAVPEVAERLQSLPSSSLILDGEVLSLRSDGSPEPFQTTMRRFGRKLRVEEMRQSQPLHAFFFDCLHQAGSDLVDLPTAERWAALDGVVGVEARVPRLVSADPAEAASFFERALDTGHEGVMAKALDASYVAGRRGSAWLKIKSHHTLDLVVIGVEWGSGRRQGWLSNLHLGARDAAGGFVMVGKTFKGLTDEILRWQTSAFLEREVSRVGHVVFVRPELVVEIAFNDVQASPHYPGGVALRFARVRRFRPDKRADQADTIETVRGLCPAPG